MIGNKILSLIKDFFKNLFLKHLTIRTIKKLGIIHFLSNLLLIRGFLIWEKIFNIIFQIGLKNGGSSLKAVQIFFVLKSKGILNFSNQIVKFVLSFFPIYVTINRINQIIKYIEYSTKYNTYIEN